MQQPDISQIPHTPGWALATGLAGQGLIVLALVAFLAAVLNSLLPKPPLPDKSTGWLFRLGAVGLFAAIICLGTLFANNQFGFNYVFGHSDADIEFKYKIAGIWAGQQGSFLLWACTSAIFGLLAMPKEGPYRRWFLIFFSVFLATLCGILTYETPFEVARIQGAALLPPRGAGLTPSLQNYWVVIHPPTIFMGFGSLTVAAAYGFAAMLSGNLKDWVAPLRPWAIVSTSILGIGLCMGGFWAYETLGWGGFWAWDPVENVSFVPWIFSIALIHGLLVQQNRRTWYGTNLVLAGLPFFVFSYGTFLTRSGFLSEASVHSFAQMNKVALWILAIFVLLGAIGYFVLYAMKGRKLAQEMVAPNPQVAQEAGLTKERAYASGVLLLCALAASTAIGMSVPFFLALMNRNSKVVEEPLYHKVVVWFFVPIMLLMAVGPFISWRSMKGMALFNRISTIGAITFGLTGVALLGFKFSDWGINDKVSFPFNIDVPNLPWVTLLVALCIFSAVANIWRVIESYRSSIWSIGGFIAHLGLAILMSGLIISRGFERKEQVLVQDGQVTKGLDYQISYQGVTSTNAEGLYNRDNKAQFDMVSTLNKSDKFTATPGFYFVQNSNEPDSPMVWPYLEHRFTHDIYFTLHPPQINVWDTPIPFKTGETKDPDSKGVEVTYNGYHAKGSPGAGREFVADLVVRVKDSNNNWRTHEAHPTLKISSEGLQQTPDLIDKDLGVMLSRIDAATHSADLQVVFNRAIFPVDLFYKPMVILVWIGAGVMTLGGFIAAFYRRPPRPKSDPVKPKRKLVHKPEPDEEPTL